MKKLLIIAAALTLSVVASAQQKGDFFVGGTLGFNTYGGATTDKWYDKDNKKTDTRTEPYNGDVSFSLSPEFGYFIMDNLKLGASLSFSTAFYPSTYIKALNEFDFDEDNEQKFVATDVRFGLGISANYYINILKGVYYTPGVSLRGYIGAYNDREYYGGDKFKNTLYGMRTGLDLLAVEIRPDNHFAFCVNAGGLYWNVSNQVRDYKNETYTWTDSQVSFDILSGASVGVRYYF